MNDSRLFCDLDAFAEWHIGHPLREFAWVATHGPQHGERRLVAKIAAVDVKVRDVHCTRDVGLLLLELCERRGKLGTAATDWFEFDQVAGQERVDTLHGGVAVENRNLVHRTVVKRRLRFGTSSG